MNYDWRITTSDNNQTVTIQIHKNCYLSSWILSLVGTTPKSQIWKGHHLHLSGRAPGSDPGWVHAVLFKKTKGMLLQN